MQAGGGEITIWGAFGAHGKSDLYMVDDNMNQHQYRRVFEQHVISFARRTFQDTFILQGDNATAHRVRTVAVFL